MDANGIRQTLHRLAEVMKGDLLTQVGGIKNPSMQIIGGTAGWRSATTGSRTNGSITGMDPGPPSTPRREHPDPPGRLLYELDAVHERCGIRRG